MNRRFLFLIAAALAVIEVIIIAFVPLPDTGTLTYQLTVIALRGAPALGAFLVAGAALRPRGSVGLGIALGASIYFVIGAITTVAVNEAVGVSVAELGPIPVVQMVAWPELLVVFAQGDYTF